jgi:hypothetical protein
MQAASVVCEQNIYSVLNQVVCIVTTVLYRSVNYTCAAKASIIPFRLFLRMYL